MSVTQIILEYDVLANEMDRFVTGLVGQNHFSAGDALYLTQSIHQYLQEPIRVAREDLRGPGKP